MLVLSFRRRIWHGTRKYRNLEQRDALPIINYANNQSGDMLPYQVHKFAPPELSGFKSIVEQLFCSVSMTRKTGGYSILFRAVIGQTLVDVVGVAASRILRGIL